MLPYVKQIASGNLLCDTGSSTQGSVTTQSGWDGKGNGSEVQEWGTYIYLWLSHTNIWQKPKQYCKLSSNLKKSQKTKTPLPEELNPP